MLTVNEPARGERRWGCQWVAARTRNSGFASYNPASGPVAQSVEQRIENPCVGGSIPPQATSLAGRSTKKRATLFHRTDVARFCPRSSTKPLVRASTFSSIKKVTCMLDIQVGKTQRTGC